MDEQLIHQKNSSKMILWQRLQIEQTKQTILLQQKPQTDKIDRHSPETTGIEALKEILGLLRITEDYVSDGNKTIKPASEEMLTVPISAIYNETVQAVIPKSMILGPGWFDSDQTKFEDWQRER